MTEKERIGIINLKEQCKHCRVIPEEFDGICPDCKECRKGMTRAEAVEKMAGEMFGAACAICGDPEKTWRDCDLLPTTIIFYLGMAEAALDALLEVSK